MTKPFALIIEDDPQLGKIFALTLQAYFDTEICMDGRAAINRLGQLRPGLVILDLHLPGVSGFDILMQMRNSATLADIPVFLATADHTAAETLSDLVDVVLLKPISPSQLLEFAVRFSGAASNA